MKHLFTLVLILALVQEKAQAQAYVPFIQQGKTWQVWNHDANFICHVHSAYHFFFNGDSIVNNVSYKKLDHHPIISAYSPTLFCPPFWVDPSITVSGMLLREDTTSRIVYQLNPDSTETVLFNFNLNIGDTIPECNSVVDTIVLQTLMDGTIVHRFELSFGDYIVESIGGSHAFYYPCMPVGAFTAFDCVNLNGNLLFFGYSSGYNCIGFVGLDENKPSAEPEFSQANQCIQLENSTHYQNYHLELYDLSGKKIAYGHQNESIICLPGETVSGSVFIVRLFDGNGVMQTKISWQN